MTVTSASQNLAGAAANAHGVKTATARLRRYVAVRKDTPVTALLAQEVNAAMLVQLDDTLPAMQRAGGGHGRFIWVSDDADVIDGGFFTAPDALDKDTKQCAWTVYRIDGALSCEGSMHLEYKNGATADAIRVKQARYFAAELLKVATKHGVPAENVLLAGDTNSRAMVVDALAADGWVNVAAGGPFEDTPTFIGWDGKSAERFDYALVRPGATAELVAVTADTDIFDHAGLRIARTLTA